jgi:AcrR family transcriptional regulator
MKQVSDEKRDRILRAARDRFLRYGFKRTSMDDIAQLAGISRAALYLQFPNKEGIFRTLSQEMHAAAHERFTAALGAGGLLAERLLAAFEGKDHEFFEVVRGSAHGTELVDFNHGIGADIVEHADALLKEALVGGIEQAAAAGEIRLERIGMDAAECADLLLHASHGLKHGSAVWPVYRRRLEHLIRLLILALDAG